MMSMLRHGAMKKKGNKKNNTQYFIVKEYYTTINIYLPLSRERFLRNLNFIIYCLDCDFISLTHKIYIFRYRFR